MTGRRVAPRAGLPLLVGALMVAVLVLVLARPDTDDPQESATPPPTESTSATPSPPAVPPSEEAFCIEFRRLAATQSEYAAAPDARATELLREAADRMVAVGVPESMSLAARGGYYTLISGIYGSIGLELDPSAVPGAREGEQIEGSDAAFSAWLADLCPA